MQSLSTRKPLNILSIPSNQTVIQQLSVTNKCELWIKNQFVTELRAGDVLFEEAYPNLSGMEFRGCGNFDIHYTQVKLSPSLTQALLAQVKKEGYPIQLNGKQIANKWHQSKTKRPARESPIEWTCTEIADANVISRRAKATPLFARADWPTPEPAFRRSIFLDGRHGMTKMEQADDCERKENLKNMTELLSQSLLKEKEVSTENQEQQRSNDLAAFQRILLELANHWINERYSDFGRLLMFAMDGREFVVDAQTQSFMNLYGELLSPLLKNEKFVKLNQLFKTGLERFVPATTNDQAPGSAAPPQEAPKPSTQTSTPRTVTIADLKKAVNQNYLSEPLSKVGRGSAEEGFILEGYPLEHLSPDLSDTPQAQ